MIELLILLLPVAAATGWYLAYRNYHTQSKTDRLDHAGYFKGLNYLLNEQPDKAIDVFVDLLEVDDETIEVHLALGSLFRKRGEVEKAIRLHQNLIARPELNPQLRIDVLNELGMDYMRAGLLDRAENIFTELEKHTSHRSNAIQQLLSIFQQEKEWIRAIDYAKKLELMLHKPQPTLLSHLHCEVADEFKKQHEVIKAKEYFAKALKIDRHCVRAAVAQATLFIESKAYKKALNVLLRVKQQDNRFVGVFLDMILLCYEQLNQSKEKLGFLFSMQKDIESDIITQRYIEELKRQRGELAAISFVQDKLKNSPGLMYLALYAKLSGEKIERGQENILLDTLANIYEVKFNFQCQHCGFNAKELSWHCPSCKSWGTTIPVHARAAFSSAPNVPN